VNVRGRLVRIVVTIVVLAVIIFGGITYFAIDHTLRTSFRSQLDTLVAAVESAVDVHHGRVNLDKDDREEISSLHPGLPYALYDRYHVQVLGDLLPAPSQRAGLVVATVPVTRKGVTYGWIAAWESNAWIAAFDRGMAFGILAVGVLLVLTGIALAQRTGNALDAMLVQVQGGYQREQRFAADASHELRTPLAVIRAETDLALRRERSVSEYRNAMQSIAREARRLEDLTDQLLAASRSHLDARDVDVVDVGALVDEVAQRVRPAAEVRDVKVVVSANGKAFTNVSHPMVERALLAVVHNAIVHAKHGGVVELRSSLRANAVDVTVADDGSGFSPEALKHATERFWRGDAARTRGGTGLGLSIAHSMLAANGGSIAVANRPEGGALVTLTLPQMGASAAE
jgi:signal transduction histidine kinase